MLSYPCLGAYQLSVVCRQWKDLGYGKVADVKCLYTDGLLAAKTSSASVFWGALLIPPLGGGNRPVLQSAQCEMLSYPCLGTYQLSVVCRQWKALGPHGGLTGVTANTGLNEAHLPAVLCRPRCFG